MYHLFIYRGESAATRRLYYGQGPLGLSSWGEGRGLMGTRKHEQTRGVRMLPQEKFKFKSSEIALNASNAASSNIHL